MPEMTQETMGALFELWAAAEAWAHTDSARENTPQEDRIVEAISALHKLRQIALTTPDTESPQ